MRCFGRFELRRLLGKSAATMSWLVFDPREGAEAMLTLPRAQPTGEALGQWQRDVRLGVRLDHPGLASVVEVGEHEQWPFIAVDRRQGVTLPEWLAEHPRPKPAEVVGWIGQLLRGLAFAHEAGLAHRDLQLHHVLIDERGAVRLMALGAASVGVGVAKPAGPGGVPGAPAELRIQRDAALRDLTACGVLLHWLLSDQPVLDQPDIALVLDRMAPAGHELVRLPWTTPWPVPEALRAIANRCTSGQERLRYRSSRTLLGALTGWLEAQAEDGGGPVALLIDRLHSVGHLPARPGLGQRVARITDRDSQRTDEIADQILEDLALSFELLRTLNTAQVQGTQVQGNGAVLTLRRIVALIGIDGVRRAANVLRPWPGPLGERQAAALERTIERASRAGRVAEALRPAGYDAQVVYLITVLQNLGRLLVAYHFADEAEQIEQLIRPGRPSGAAGEAEQPGLREEAAAWAVLGVDIESLGLAAARQWGFGDEVLQMIRRIPPDTPVHRPDSDTELLRLTASAANDLVDASELHTGTRAGVELGRVAQRYARALSLGSRELLDALQAGRAAAPETPDADASAPADGKKKVTSLTPALVATVGAASFPT